LTAPQTSGLIPPLVMKCFSEIYASCWACVILYVQTSFNTILLVLARLTALGLTKFHKKKRSKHLRLVLLPKPARICLIASVSSIQLTHFLCFQTKSDRRSSKRETGQARFCRTVLQVRPLSLRVDLRCTNQYFRKICKPAKQFP